MEFALNYFVHFTKISIGNSYLIENPVFTAGGCEDEPWWEKMAGWLVGGATSIRKSVVNKILQ